MTGPVAGLPVNVLQATLTMNETHIVWSVADGRIYRPNLQELK